MIDYIKNNHKSLSVERFEAFQNENNILDH